ncbi:MAG: hypothetical protein KKA54_19250 [Proteobacteria bacterium]|nr:hypothetical protein [Pseudomonadota bacterium]
MSSKKGRLSASRLFLFSTTTFLSFSLLNGCAQAPSGDKGTMSAFFKGPQKIEQISQDVTLTVPKNNNQQANLGAPLTIFIEKDFIGSGRCALCHGNLVDKEDRDMSITNHWRSTMMGNAARDPLWQAKVDSETSRNPAIKQVIEEKCVSCHMPMAWRQLNTDKQAYGPGASGTPFDTFIDPTNQLYEAALDGVSCSLCHQIEDQGLGTKDNFSGKFSIDTQTPAPDRPIFGPYKETVPEPMQTSLGFKPVYSAHTNDSALCATCHTLYTPYLDSAGNIAGEFPEQTPYLEWLHSEYGEPLGIRHDISEKVGTVRLCQECHMPHSPAGGVLIAMPAPKDSTEKDHFSQHHFVGGNILLLNMMQDNVDLLGVTASTDKIEDTKKRAAALLQQESATLSLYGGGISKGTLTAAVAVESKVGHKFPTGFPSRRAWLHVMVQDTSGAVIFESGKPQTDGTIVGDDGDEKNFFEPHYDVITKQDQVQIYESVMHNTDGEVTYTLLRGSGYIKDNRLLPKGFDKNTAIADIAVKGAATTDENFTGGSDLVTYQVPVGNNGGPFTITAELLYTSVSHAFAQDLGQDNSLPRVGRFMGYYSTADKTPVTIAGVKAVTK